MIRWSWKRTGIALFLAFSANGIQSLISPLWHYSHPLLDLPLLVTIFYATLYPTTGALLMGWTTGLFQDLFSGNALGVNALSKLVVAYLATTLEEKIEIQDLLPVQAALLIFYVAMDGGIGYLGATQFLQRSWQGGIFNPNFLFSLIINPLFYLVFFYLPTKRKRRKLIGKGG